MTKLPSSTRQPFPTWENPQYELITFHGPIFHKICYLGLSDKHFSITTTFSQEISADEKNWFYYVEKLYRHRICVAVTPMTIVSYIWVYFNKEYILWRPIPYFLSQSNPDNPRYSFWSLPLTPLNNLVSDAQHTLLKDQNKHLNYQITGNFCLPCRGHLSCT